MSGQLEISMEYFSYPDGDPKADQGKARLGAEKSFYNKGLGFGDVVVAYGEQDDDGRDEGEDVGGDDDGAPGDQVVGCPILAIVLIADAKAKHDAANDQLQQALAARRL